MSNVYSNRRNFIYLADVKSSITPGGDFNSGADRTRILNTEIRDTGNLCTLSSNQFTLLPGRYKLRSIAPAYRVDRHQAFLFCVTDNNEPIIGSPECTVATDQVVTWSKIEDILIIDTAKTYEIRHRCFSTQATQGFGVESNFGRNNIYTQVWIETF